jgi:hypothetical protein
MMAARVSLRKCRSSVVVDVDCCCSLSHWSRVDRLTRCDALNAGFSETSPSRAGRQGATYSKCDFAGMTAQMSQTIAISRNELVELRGLRLLFRFEFLTNLLRKAPERIVFLQLLQRIVFRWVGEGFSLERVRAAIKR